MPVKPKSFELPKNVDRFLGILSRHYAQAGKRQLQELIVNARTRIDEGSTYDNWNGGTYGHALYLIIPESLYSYPVKQREEIQSEICKDLNEVQHVENEWFSEVFLEMAIGDSDEWRKESGLLIAGTRPVPPDAGKRIWGDSGFRVFLSHKAEMKTETSELKDRLKPFGISSFVAHQDIHPTKQWQDEIEYALSTMDAFVALMTPEFHDSSWTDQEVGFAFARGVPIIAVRLGLDPYGFIGKFQALSSTWLTAADGIVKLLIKNERMFTAYIQMLRSCPSWDGGNVLGRALAGIDSLEAHQIDEMVAAFNETSELRGSFAFNGTKPRLHGRGIVPFLNKLGSRQFRYDDNGLIEPIV